MAVLNKVWPTRARGGTIPFKTIFYDAFDQVQNPTGTPQVVINYPLLSGGTATVILPMTPPGGTLPNGSLNISATAWLAEWDSRNAGSGTVFWSIETPGSPPVSVEDGQINLVANAANQPTF